MLTKSIEMLATDLGLKNISFGGTKDERAFGIYKNYLLSVGERDGKKTAFFRCTFNTDEDSVFAFEFSQALSETLNDIAECICTVEDHGVTVSSSCDLSDFRQIIDETAEMLAENEIPTSNKCSKCGTSFDHKKIMVLNKDGVLSLICESCALTESMDNSKKKKAEKVTAAQRVKGILGAFLGALIGFALILGISYGVDRLINTEVSLSLGVSALCFGSVALTYFFAKLLCKSKDIGVTLSVCAFSLIFNAAARIIITAYQILTAYGFNLSAAFRSFGSFLRLPFSTSADGVNLTQALIIDILFGLVALAIFAFGLFSTSKKSDLTIETYIK